jgi:hypothetical protein
MDIIDFTILNTAETNPSERPYKVYDERGEKPILVASARTKEQAQDIVAMRNRMGL